MQDIQGYTMLFEYDQRKDESNQEKHGVSFAEAQGVWRDSDLLVVHARKRGERRLMAIGKSCSVLYSVVHTRRGEVIRIISARRSTRKETKAYEQHRKGR